MLTVDNNKQTSSIVIDKVKTLDESLHRQRVPVDQVQFVDGQLGIPDHLLALDAMGYRRLCNEVGAPWVYLQRLGGDLRSRVLSHHLEEGDLTRGSKDGSISVFWRGETFVGFGRADLITLRAPDVLYAVQDAVRGELGDKVDNFMASSRDRAAFPRGCGRERGIE